MALMLTANRMNRFPFHIERWEKNISVAIETSEEELPSLVKTIALVKRDNIRYTFQVIKKTKEGCRFFYNNRTIIYDSCFDINLLRDLAIETVTTTHFLIVDGDAIISRMSS